MSGKYTLIFAAESDVGQNRDLNEDAYLTAGNVFAVADGMGGHQAGEIASELALKTALRNLKKDLPPGDRIKQAFNIANNQVINRANRNAGQFGMGTTLTLALIEDGDLWIGHIGDSRAYLFSRGELTQVTEDHTLVAHLVKEGEIDIAEAGNHPKRHVITKAIGSQPMVDPDVFPVKIGPGDRLLLCSDGLTTMLDDSEIASVVAVRDPQEAASELVSRANAKGGHDNITVVVVDIDGAGGPQNAKPARKRRPLIILSALLAALLFFELASLEMRRVYFLGEYRQKVAIYQGLPVKIGGYSFYRLNQQTGISIKRLPNYYRQRINAGIVVVGLEKTKAALKDIATLESK